MNDQPILPGATLGVFGGGQLGRMFTLAARRMGYRVHVLTPEQDSPTGQTADEEIVAAYTDMEAVGQFARGVRVVTFEFENVASEPLDKIAHHVPVRPSSHVLHISQHRLREKTFLSENGFPVTPFHEINSFAQLEQFAREFDCKCVLKTASFGYDGKGQTKINSPEDLAPAWKKLGEGVQGILEKWVEFDREISVIVARGVSGETEVFPVAENLHRHHILDMSIVPARIPEAVSARAKQIALGIAEAIGLVGVLAVEMFLTHGKEVIVNELAPRPHNSGHYSFDACVTSQFEQQLRAVCALPLGSTALLSPCVMVNILGDVWHHGEPDFAAVLQDPDLKLHLYGKSEPKPGRKMGHFVCFGSTVQEALDRAQTAKKILGIPQ
ncbi:5-(carboxyamino)imidazole ribonucleotide synthase [Kamptonema cortianum]|nr:5-(carboxyamino)imidazole ribonucleotide synthase [Oscillatoria laete-virens]MDK3156465.1 5-(carboxyamino)imidazole ribonucleotide synthase [Kamptonema cortianum]MDL5053851.1 5-(carboxyamino)imidazole ribonucleotide synthase [Oscillatoria laete-virens NRMC-F 0139]